jgi:hypothetical protein
VRVEFAGPSLNEADIILKASSAVPHKRADNDLGKHAATMEFQAQQTFEGLVDRSDDLPKRLE